MRIRVISNLIVVMACALCAGLVYTQIVNYKKYATLSLTNRVRLVPIEGMRGNFYDRNGIRLVDNRPSFDVIVMPQELENSMTTLSRVAALVGMQPRDIFASVEKNYTAPFAPITVKEDIDKKTAITLEEQAFSLPGVMVKATPKREYRYRDAASHIVGYVGEISKDELDRLRGYGYQMRDRIGKTGLEKQYDNYIRGEEGGMQLEVNNRGYFIKSLGTKEAVAGKDLFLTVDIRLQQYIDELFAGKAGACVVMDVRTGEVLALVSRPGFDPNMFADRERSGEVTALLGDPSHPLLNRAAAGTYPLGSVFKPIVAIAALEKKKISADDRFYCGGTYTLGGQLFNCWDEEGHKDQDVREGLKNSCNVFFYQVGRLVGIDDMSSFAQRFGFGTPTGIDLPGEASGFVPNRLWKRLAKKEPWFEGDTVNLAIGQGYLLVTPLQVGRMMAAIGNGGNLVQPYLVRRIGDVEVHTIKSRPIGISKKCLDIVKGGLRRVVEDDSGTGRRARVEGLRIAGKTGTAQDPSGPSHAWFAGFSPVDDPRIAVVVCIEHGGKGGLEACEFASAVFKKAREVGLL